MSEPEEKVVVSTEQQTQQHQMEMNQLFNRVVETRTGIFNRLFPTAMDRIKDHHLEKIIVQEFESRAEKMRIIGEHQKQALMEFLNSNLMTLKEKLRADSIKRYTEKLNELEKHITEQESRFIDNWVSHESKILTVKNDVFRKQLIDQAEKKSKLILEGLFEALQYFQNIKDEIIRSGTK